MATDIYLKTGEANPNDVRLITPTQPDTGLFANSSFSFATTIALTTIAAFAAASTLGVSTASALTVTPTLAATTEIDVSSGITLSTLSRLAANSSLSFTTDVNLYGPALLYADSTITFGTTPPVLSTGSAPLAATSWVAFATSTALSSLPAEFTATSAIQFAAQADLTSFGVGVSALVVEFNGVPGYIQKGSLNVSDIINEAPNSCTFLIRGTPPNILDQVKVGLSNTAPQNLKFAGSVERVVKSFTDSDSNIVWQVHCIDYTFTLNRYKVFGDFVKTSATTVGQAILAFCPGFTGTNIVAGLPAITISFGGDDAMRAFSRVATLIGGYADVDYNKDCYLFVNNPGIAPDPIDVAHMPLNDPAFTYQTDVSQLRNRVFVKGRSAQTQSSALVGASAIAVDDSSGFIGGKVITDNNQILDYVGSDAGKGRATVVGNVTTPGSSGTPAIAAAVSGALSGTYQWAVAFANANGETPVGSRTYSLFCPDVAAPSATLGIGVTGAVGPLVGAYSYKTAFVTSLGETLLGPSTSRTASAILAGVCYVNNGVTGISRLTPGAYSWKTTYVTQYGETIGGSAASWTMQDVVAPTTLGISSSGPGPLVAGSIYAYKTTFLTQDGETAAGSASGFTAPALLQAGLSLSSYLGFGGLYGGPYNYGVTIVTAKGESSPPNAFNTGSGLYTSAPGAGYYTGSFNTGGRIAPGYTYYYAISAYSDTYGETPLSPSFNVPIGGVSTIRLLIGIPGLPTGADGLRIYRAIQGGIFVLNAEFRRNTGVPSLYWDELSSSENGAQFPVQTLRCGVGASLYVSPSSEPGVAARRIYRTKSGGGSEYFFVAEVQNNYGAYITDNALDAQLATRSPVLQTTGHTAILSSIPLGPLGCIGRRIYRTKANGSTYYLVGEIKDNSTSNFTDSADDSQLTIAAPGLSTAGSIFNSAAQPRVIVPIGPAGVVTRRVWRTKSGGSTYYLLGELKDNITTILDDNIPDTALGSQTILSVSTAGGDTHSLTSIPTGPSGTLARRIYRTVAGGSEYRLLQQISGNATTTFTDATADANLGPSAPLVNSAGASAALISGIPLGPGGITQRIIYRTKGDGSSTLFYAGTLSDNVSSTYTDKQADTALGRPPFTTSTIGALAGDTVMLLDSTVNFLTPGWVNTGNQIVKYTGISGNSLTGIPSLTTVSSITAYAGVATLNTASPHEFVTGQKVTILGATPAGYNGSFKITVTGTTQFTYAVGSVLPPATGAIQCSAEGAIVSPVPGGTIVAAVPQLFGVTGITRFISDATGVSLWSQKDDAASQASYGVFEHIVADSNLRSADACDDRGAAELVLFKDPIIQITYTTFDIKSKSGRRVHVDMPSLNIRGDFTIQQVNINEFDTVARIFPRHSVTASTVRYTLEDILRHVVLD